MKDLFKGIISLGLGGAASLVIKEMLDQLPEATSFKDKAIRLVGAFILVEGARKMAEDFVTETENTITTAGQLIEDIKKMKGEKDGTSKHSTEQPYCEAADGSAEEIC